MSDIIQLFCISIANNSVNIPLNSRVLSVNFAFTDKFKSR